MNRLRTALAATALALLAGCQESADTTKSASSSGSNDVALKSESTSAKSEAKAATGTGTGGIAGTAGTTGTGATAASNKSGASGTSVASSPSAAKIDYQEVRVGNNVYVVGSAEAAQKAQAGKLEKPVRAIGFGEPGEKVYFEEKNQAALEAEFNRRHDGK